MYDFTKKLTIFATRMRDTYHFWNLFFIDFVG